MADAMLEVLKSTSAISVSKFGALKRISKKQQLQQQRNLSSVKIASSYCELEVYGMKDRKMVLPEEQSPWGQGSKEKVHPWDQREVKPYPNAVRVLPPVPLHLHNKNRSTTLCNNQLKEENL